MDKIVVLQQETYIELAGDDRMELPMFSLKDDYDGEWCLLHRRCGHHDLWLSGVYV
ncbi:MAG: hypothetical protein ACRCZI_09905 [Cetobacterium sp.]